MNLSLIGSWMQSIALPWLVLSITADAFKLSLVAAAQFVPTLFFTPFSGVLLDKFDRKKILLFAQIGMALVASIFAVMSFCEIYSFEKILSLALTSGIFTSLDAPTRQSIIKDLLDEPQSLPNAIALNSMSFNVARIVGPALAKLSLGADEWSFGYLMSALGGGAFCGALFIAIFGKLGPRKIWLCALAMGLSLALVGAVSSFLWAGACLALTGFLFVATSSSINSTVQMHVSNEFRGRVMSIYALFFVGSTPLGALFSGFLISRFGARAALAICGGISISALLALFYKFKKGSRDKI